LVNDLADAVYLSHEPQPNIDLHQRLESNPALAAQLLTDISVGAISDSDPAIASAILTNRIQHAQFDLATQFLQVLADDNVALLDSADSNHRELLAVIGELVHQPAAEQARLSSYPKPADVQMVDTGLLDEIRALVETTGSQMALVGSNGTGKTFHAQRYAAEIEDDVDIVWWVRASDRAVAEVDLLELSRASGGEVPGDDPRSVVSYLSTTERPWLLIFDNAGQPRDFSDLVPTGSGTVIVTTNYEDWGDFATTIPVKAWNEAQAADFLFDHAAGDDQATRDAALRIAEALGHHPLACPSRSLLCEVSAEPATL